MEPNDILASPGSLPPTPYSGENFLRGKLPIVVVIIVVIGVVVALLISRGILKVPSSQSLKKNQSVTDEQKIQNLKNLSGNSSASPQPSDQEKLQMLQKLSPPRTQQNAPQQSDAEKLKMLQQLGGQ